MGMGQIHLRVTSDSDLLSMSANSGPNASADLLPESPKSAEAVGVAAPEKVPALLAQAALAIALVHAGPALLDLFRASYDLIQAHAWEYRTLAGLSHDLFTPALFGASWPLLLALFSVWLRWRELLPAAALTFTFAASSDAARAYFAAVGKVDYEPWPGLSLRHLVWLDAGYHVLAAVLTGVLVFGLLRANRRPRGTTRKTRLSSSRPAAIAGRLAVVGALLFGGFVAFAQAWVVYEKYGLQIGALRSLMARPPQSRPRGMMRLGNQRRLSPQNQGRAEGALEEIQRAGVLTSQGRYADAQRAYFRGLQMLELLVNETNEPTLAQGARARGFNNLAWMLCTCPDRSFWDAKNAVRFARRSVELESGAGNSWNTLGVALYRAGNLTEARDAFEKSMTLRGGDAMDWFFLAMIEQKQNQRDAALEWFEKSVTFREQQMLGDDELYRFHVEAAEVLGLEVPKPPTPGTSPPGRIRDFRSPVGPSPPGGL